MLMGGAIVADTPADCQTLFLKVDVEDFVSKGYSKNYVRSFSAVLQQSFRFAVFPKQYITFNPMQYVVMRHKKDDMDLFAEETDAETVNAPK